MADNGVSRRRWLAAAPLGAAAVVGAAGGAAVASNQGYRRGGISPADSPVVDTIASPRLAGQTYLTASGRDLFSTAESGRSAGGFGYHSSGNALTATFDIPAGAQIQDVEIYCYNSSGSARSAYLAYWVAGEVLNTVLATINVPSQSDLVAILTPVSAAHRGPFPTGMKIAVIFNNTSSTFQANGARLGLSNGGGHLGVRTQPAKVFDSTEAGSGGKFSAEEVRIVPLPVGIVPNGTVGVVLRVTASQSTANGTVAIFPANQSSFDVETMSFLNGVKCVGEATVAIKPSRELKVYASQAAHVRLDVVATIS